MKHQGNFSDFTHLRNKELMRAFREVFAKKMSFDISKDFELVVNSPCSRFWISEERATAIISSILRGNDALVGMRQSKQEMFKEILSRVIALRDKNPDMQLRDIVFQVVNSPAPKFYMKPRHAREIIYKIKKGHFSRHSHSMDNYF